MSFAVGTLVRARGREWVVLPESEGDLLVLRPLGGTDEEVAGVLTSIEDVEPATFALPDPERVGDFVSARLLRDALRLGFRSSAGPFRSFGRIAVDPRPYQLVPLLMALRMDPVRLLIADDVGIGKTVEAGLIARELLDRGLAKRMAVLCPPHLAEQWQNELASKFHLDAELVLASTASRLERGLPRDLTIFDVNPWVIVSTDFIKAERRRHEFQRTCPELVIVDEAHTCAFDPATRSARHQRHELIKGLTSDESRHLILVTATPHSGNEGAFRSLLELLDPKLGALPEDLSGPENQRHRRELARYLVQRQRGDIKHFLGDTPFPDREEGEADYRLSPEYRKLFDRVVDYARETVRDPAGGAHRQRVRWWSALALLRSMASSPAAAAATLRERSKTADTDSVDRADEIGRREILDEGDTEEDEVSDVTPGGDFSENGDAKGPRKRLLGFAREADKLCGDKDAKLIKAVALIKGLLKDGYSPIVFCRYIPTADYLAAELRKRLAKTVTVEAVTGRLPAPEREARVDALGESEPRVLVATDCLSEGINLQDHFDAVLHYDLSWNPTRHEQRAGRVDRFGQSRDFVRVLTYYGTDNRIDGIVLDVLLRKHEAIRKRLGVSVPVPANSQSVVEAILEGLLLRREEQAGLEQLVLSEEMFQPERHGLHDDWEQAAERERRSRSIFAQESIKVEEVAAELDEARAAVGGGADLADFVRSALKVHRAVVSGTDPVRIDLKDVPRALKDLLGESGSLTATFEPAGNADMYLQRTHPFVEGLASYVIDSALDPVGDGVARRCGAIRTKAVTSRTTLLLCRLRMHLITVREGTEHALLAEDAALMAFEGSPESPNWLDPNAAEALLDTKPDANVPAGQATEFVRKVIDAYDRWATALDAHAKSRAEELLDAHKRVRAATRSTGVRYTVEPQLPPDILGIYVFLPA